MSSGSTKKPVAVYGAMAANLAIAISKFVAGALTGSSAMFSEGIHSLVDTGNESLLLIGLRMSAKPPDETHPFGHGQDLYFWSLIVALILFGVGGGVSAYEGLLRLQHPGDLGNITINYIVLGISALFEGSSFVLGFRQLRRTRKGEGFWEGLQNSKDPTVFVVLFEDSAALAGLTVAFLGLFLGNLLSIPELDAVASIGIGLILAVAALMLAYRTRRLLLGQSVEAEHLKSIRQVAEHDPAVERIRNPLTMHFGPNEVLLNLDVQFKKGLTAPQIAAAVDRLERAIRNEHPDIKRIFIEAESLSSGEPGTWPQRAPAKPALFGADGPGSDHQEERRGKDG